MAGKRIAILGSGAQGSGVGADMVRAGLDVTFVEQWPDHVEAMRRHGIEVRMPEEATITPVHAMHLCEVATLRQPFDIVFLVTKAYDTRWACELIKPVLAPDGLVVGLQNGMSIDDIASVVGPERTIGAVIEMASNMFEPGVVNRENSPATAWFAVGAFDERTRGREQEVWEALRHAGTVEISDDIRSSKWMKLVANAGELVPSAILGLPLADAAAVPGVREFMDRCCREAAEATVASGSRLRPVFGLTDADVTSADTYAPALLDVVLQKFSSPTTRTTVLQDWMKGVAPRCRRSTARWCARCGRPDAKRRPTSGRSSSRCGSKPVRSTPRRRTPGCSSRTPSPSDIGRPANGDQSLRRLPGARSYSHAVPDSAPSLIDPSELYSDIATEPQYLQGAGLDSEMTSAPDLGADSYTGHGRLVGRRKALVTGGDSGIGAAAAIAFAREGADVAIVLPARGAVRRRATCSS